MVRSFRQDHTARRLVAGVRLPTNFMAGFILLRRDQMTFFTNTVDLTWENVHGSLNPRLTITAEPGEAYYDSDGLVWFMSRNIHLQYLNPGYARYENVVLLPPEEANNQGLEFLQQYVVPAVTSLGIHLASTHTISIVSLLAKAARGDQVITNMVNNILDNYFRVPDRDWGYYRIENKDDHWGDYELVNGKLAYHGTLHVEM